MTGVSPVFTLLEIYPNFKQSYNLSRHDYGVSSLHTLRKLSEIQAVLKFKSPYVSGVFSLHTLRKYPNF